MYITHSVFFLLILNGRIENYQELEQIFKNFPEKIQNEIIVCLKAGINFINQTNLL